MSASLPKLTSTEERTSWYPSTIQRRVKVEVCGSCLAMVGSAMMTMVKSRLDITVARLVLESTTHLRSNGLD